jgi:hypothetical protein
VFEDLAGDAPVGAGEVEEEELVLCFGLSEGGGVIFGPVDFSGDGG